MTTLDTAPLAELLRQLFIDADATSAMFKQQLNALPAEQRAATMASKDEYIAFYLRAKDVHLAVLRETGKLLYMLARAADRSPDYLARVRPPGKGYMSVPFADDIELPMRVAALGKA